MTHEPRSFFDQLSAALHTMPLLRLIVMACLTTFLLLPVEWIHELITERTTRRSDAVEEVSGKWGRRQTVSGPFLTVPYEHRWVETTDKGKTIAKSERRWLTILPAQLRIQAQIDSEERSRGIFTVPVYRASLDIDGSFSLPDLKAMGINPELVDWKHSTMAIGISDVRSIQNRGATWNGAEQILRPGPGPIAIDSGVHGRIDDPFCVAQPAFALRFTLNGSAGLYFTAAGQETSVVAKSDWASPSFQGKWLPGARQLSTTGFASTWEIPFLGRNQESAWTSDLSQPLRDLESTAFGVDLITPIDAHRMAERSVKYARLFIVLTFATIWLIEVLYGVQVHPIQYLLVGCALCTFYLLELSLAEQLGFAPAYVLAAVAVAVLITLYAAAALRGTRRASIVAFTVSGLYAYLYVVLTNEDYALLLGSLILFGALAVIMLATRRIDWYAPLSQREAVQSPS